MTVGATIVVAQRLHTIANAERIVFLERGRIVESGTLDELLALKERFAPHWEQQRQAGVWRLAS